jgi:hypothetical protein
MRKMGMLLTVAMAMGCANTQAMAQAESPRPHVRVFGDGSGRIVESEPGLAVCERAWDTGVMPGGQAHGQAVRDSGWTVARQGELQITSRTQEFADGTTIYRELSANASGQLVRVRFFDTHADGARQGFRVDGPVPNAVAFAPATTRTLAAK